MSCVELNDHFDYVINCDYHDGDDGNRNRDVSYVVMCMCTEVKMVSTSGDRVERMRMSTLLLITCYKDRGLLFTMVS